MVRRGFAVGRFIGLPADGLGPPGCDWPRPSPPLTCGYGAEVDAVGSDHQLRLVTNLTPGRHPCLAPFARLHWRWAGTRLSRVSVPPLARATTWSIWKLSGSRWWAS